MAIDPDILQLVSILEQVGFGAVAGELLTEISLGYEVEVSYPERVFSWDGDDSDKPESELRREPIENAAQFEFAMAFLHGRLVVPALALSEAERLAGSLGDRKEGPVAIVLSLRRDSEEPHTGLSAAYARMPGDDAPALKLADILKNLPLRREPPATSS